MKIGLIGYGSIGRRHISNLISLGFNDITLFREIGRGNQEGLREIFNYNDFINEEFDFIIISNPTSFHFTTMLPLLEKDSNILVEKPLVFRNEEYDALKKILPGYMGKGMCAYNMRFHPCVNRIKEICSDNTLGKIYSARLFVGQYLPDWRPGQDYRKGVSALRSLGGGVVLELIHEIDMALYLFGKPVSEICSIAGKLSSLEIETEDMAEIMFRTEKNIIVSIHQDYLSRGYKRTIEIIAENGSLICDLKRSEISVTDRDGKQSETEMIPFERNDMYLGLMDYYTGCILNDRDPVPGLRESLEAVRVALEVKTVNKL